MSILERRLQLLLDNRMMSRLEEEAKRDGRSVASIIREAVDFRWAHESEIVMDRRAAAIGELFAIADRYPDTEPFDPAEFNEAWEREKAQTKLFEKAPVAA